MSALPPERLASESLSATLGRNPDFAIVCAAVVAFAVAMLVKPTALCGDGAHASDLYIALGWAACLGLLGAGLVALGVRRHLAAKIGFLFACLLVTPVLAISLVLASDPMGFSLFRDNEPLPLLQDSLRELEAQAGAGKHAYWLGREFEETPVATTSGWSVGELSYFSDSTDEPHYEISVKTYPGEIPAEDLDTPWRDRTVVVRTQTGQDVRVTFRQPHDVDPAVLARARTAVQAIPRDVEYAGCG